MLTRDFLPMKRFEDYFGRMDRLFGPERLYPFAWPRDLGLKVEWAPTADIIEMDKEYLVKAELPEVPKEDIHIDIVDGMLRLHGERKYEKKDKSEKMQRMERFYGEFERTFALPDDVDFDKITRGATCLMYASTPSLQQLLSGGEPRRLALRTEFQ